MCYYKLAYMVSPGIAKPENCDTEGNIVFCRGDTKVAEYHISSYREKGVELRSDSMNPFDGDPASAGFLLNAGARSFIGLSEVLDISRWGLEDDFPEELNALDFLETEDPDSYHRGKDREKKEHDFW